MSEFKNFRSPAEDIRVTSDSGHIAVIGKELTPVHSSMWREAYSLGALSEGMQDPSMNDYIAQKKLEKEEELNELYKELIVALEGVVHDPVTYLDASGKLIYRKVIALIGRTEKKDIIDKAWAEVTSKLED
jgi:hypothetical protein